MIICVCGPTGVGKTRVSEFLAEKLDGIIINADATQVYKYLNIGSAKITKDEMKAKKHFLFDILSPDEEYSVTNFQNDARNIIKENNNENIIVIGGTGLYISALFYDYEFSKLKDNTYDNYSNEMLYNLALKKDKNMTIHKNNRVRLINFLNKENISNNKDKLLYDVIFIGLTCNREKLYNMCNKRVDNMIDLGLIDEVKNLYEKYPESKILKRAIGYKEIISYLEGNVSKTDAIENIKKNTRHYVKRQYTWFNNQLNVKWFNINIDDFSKTENEIYDYIQNKNKE